MYHAAHVPRPCTGTEALLGGWVTLCHPGFIIPRSIDVTSTRTRYSFQWFLPMRSPSFPRAAAAHAAAATARRPWCAPFSRPSSRPVDGRRIDRVDRGRRSIGAGGRPFEFSGIGLGWARDVPSAIGGSGAEHPERENRNAGGRRLWFGCEGSRALPRRRGVTVEGFGDGAADVDARSPAGDAVRPRRLARCSGGGDRHTPLRRRAPPLAVLTWLGKN